MNGSEKQVGWAEKIKKDFQTSVADFFARMDDGIEFTDCDDSRKKQYRKIAMHILTQERAGWWIDNRFNMETPGIMLMKYGIGKFYRPEKIGVQE